MRTVTIEKSGNNYTVNPNATPSNGGVSTLYYYETDGGYGCYATTHNPSIGDTVYLCTGQEFIVTTVSETNYGAGNDGFKTVDTNYTGDMYYEFPETSYIHFN